VRTFLDQQLRDALTDDERKGLERLEGKWPEYPRELFRLATAHHLTIPGMMMPEF
jgi:hypothetical protein